MIFMQALCNGQQVKGFVNSGSSCTMVTEQLARCLRLYIAHSDVIISSVSDKQIWPVGQVSCELQVNSHVIPNLTMLVLLTLPMNLSLLIGIDVLQVISKLTLMVNHEDKIHTHFGLLHEVAVATSLQPMPVMLTDVGYSTHFDGHHWEVALWWKDSVTPKLHNHVAEYAVSHNLFYRYCHELGKWINNE